MMVMIYGMGKGVAQSALVNSMTHLSTANTYYKTSEDMENGLLSIYTSPTVSHLEIFVK